MATMEDVLQQAANIHAAAVAERDAATAKVASLTDQVESAQAGYEQMVGQLDTAKKAQSAAEADRAAALGQLADKQSQIDALTKQVKDLQGQVNPPSSPNLIDPETFRERLAPAFLAYTSLKPDDPILNKWNVLIGNYFPPTRSTPVNVASPATQGLVMTAVADKLLTEEQASAVLAPNT